MDGNLEKTINDFQKLVNIVRYSDSKKDVINIKLQSKKLLEKFEVQKIAIQRYADESVAEIKCYQRMLLEIVSSVN
ncbi:MAG: hypothetical protein CMF49_03605 [Legionellales bacterium]|nr:hypothetical protein [Legionellales bacterium]|tara:strand:- start:2056 stop:2283 length:228 start_codon:yes stop_codon:yes gene_type:complete